MKNDIRKRHLKKLKLQPNDVVVFRGIKLDDMTLIANELKKIHNGKNITLINIPLDNDIRLLSREHLEELKIAIAIAEVKLNEQ